jgi:hypothetical protein
MGTVDEITSRLLETRELESDYAPAVVRAVCSPDQSWRRSPFSVQQENLLKKNTGGVSIVMGVEAAGLADISRRLRAAFGDSVIELDNIVDRAGIRRVLAKRYNGKQSDLLKNGVLTIPSSAPWSGEWVRDAVEFVDAHPAAADAQVVFAADPNMVWAMLDANKNVFEELERLGVNLVSLAPWHEQAVRQWLDDCGFAIGPDGRKRVREVTGGWPLLLYRFYELSAGDESHWESHLGEVQITGPEREVWRAAFGLAGGLGTRVIGSLAVISPASEEYILGSMQEPGWTDLVARGLEWGRRLNLLRFSGQGRWEVDAAVQQLAQDLVV